MVGDVTEVGLPIKPLERLRGGFGYIMRFEHRFLGQGQQFGNHGAHDLSGGRINVFTVLQGLR